MVWSVISWAFIGALAGALGTILFAVLAAEIFNISQREGAYAMGVAFFWVPTGTILGLVAGIVTAFVRRR